MLAWDKFSTQSVLSAESAAKFCVMLTQKLRRQPKQAWSLKPRRMKKKKKKWSKETKGRRSTFSWLKEWVERNSFSSRRIWFKATKESSQFCQQTTKWFVPLEEWISAKECLSRVPWWWTNSCRTSQLNQATFLMWEMMNKTPMNQDECRFKVKVECPTVVFFD